MKNFKLNELPLNHKAQKCTFLLVWKLTVYGRKKKVIPSASACRILLRRVSSADFRCVWVLLLHCSLPQQTAARTCLDCAVHGNVLFEMDVAESCSKTSVVKLTCLCFPRWKRQTSPEALSTKPQALKQLALFIIWFVSNGFLFNATPSTC